VCYEPWVEGVSVAVGSRLWGGMAEMKNAGAIGLSVGSCVVPSNRLVQLGDIGEASAARMCASPVLRDLTAHDVEIPFSSAWRGSTLVM